MTTFWAFRGLKGVPRIRKLPVSCASRMIKRKKEKPSEETEVSWKPEVIEVDVLPVSKELKSAGPTSSERCTKQILLSAPSARAKCTSSAFLTRPKSLFTPNAIHLLFNCVLGKIYSP